MISKIADQFGMLWMTVHSGHGTPDKGNPSFQAFMQGSVAFASHHTQRKLWTEAGDGTWSVLGTCNIWMGPLRHPDLTVISLWHHHWQFRSRHIASVSE